MQSPAILSEPQRVNGIPGMLMAYDVALSYSATSLQDTGCGVGWYRLPWIGNSRHADGKVII